MPHRTGSPVYVAPDGKDSWSGNLPEANAAGTDGPVATLARAVELSRQMERDGARCIILRGGNYYDAAVELDARDSGLTIEAAEGETPILYGGHRITGWQQDGANLWSAFLPEVRAGSRDFRMLQVNGRLCPRARLPREGRFRHPMEFKSRWVPGPAGEPHRFDPQPTLEELTTLRYFPGDLGPWLDLRNAELTVYHSWDESLVGLSAHDPANQTLTFATPATYPPGAFGIQEYIIHNIREGMHEPGQWYLDRTQGKVVYWPLPDEDMRTAIALAPTTESILQIRGTEEQPVSGLSIQGLTLGVTTTPLCSGGWAASRFQGAISATHAHDCRFLGLIVRNVAGQGLAFDHCDRLLVQDCETAFTGGGGIYHIDGQDGLLTNNYVHDVGVIYPSAIGIRVTGTRSAGNEVSHQKVARTSYSGIEGGGHHNRFEYNRFHNVMQVLNDGAAIYTSICQDLVVRGNVACDIPNKSLAFAYYFDEQSERCLLEGNLSVNVQRPIHIHMSRNCTLRDNVFVHPEAAHLSFHRSADLCFERNVVYARGPIKIWNPGAVTTGQHNFFYSECGEYIDLPSDALRADPRFLDVWGGDYRLRADSPAAQVGIASINIDVWRPA